MNTAQTRGQSVTAGRDRQTQVNRPLLFVAGAIAGAVIALLATKSALSVNVRHEIILPTIRK